VLRQAGRDLLAGQPIGLGNADRYLSDYVVALLVCLNFACARDAGFAAMMKLARPVRTLASYTFTLYLVHAVVLGAWPLLYPHDPNDPLDWLAAAVAVGLATWVLGMLTEQRKHEFRAAFERLAEQTKMCYPWRQR
jgi:peptidoglycan/LPS O-acetylase OafA/YrhL